jgi:hypothetical protein
MQRIIWRPRKEEWPDSPSGNINTKLTKVMRMMTPLISKIKWQKIRNQKKYGIHLEMKTRHQVR